MTVGNRPIEGAPLQHQDPWDWTVDQVVFALTNPDSFLLKRNPTLHLPEADEFARILYDNDVNGLALLTEVNADNIRDDLKIKSMGHRASINQLIRQLQETSAKHYEQIFVKDRRLSSTNIGLRIGTSHFGISALDYSPALSQAPSLKSRSDQLEYPFHVSSATLGANEQGVTRNNGTLLEEAKRWPFELQSAHSLINVEGSSDEEANIGAYDPQHRENNMGPENSPSASSAQHLRNGEVAIIDEAGRRRRRLMLSPPNSSPSTELVYQKPTPPDSPQCPASICRAHTDEVPIATTPRLDSVSPSDHAEENPPPNLVTMVPNEATSASTNQLSIASEPGVVFHDKCGRKRVIPILVAHPSPLSINSPQHSSAANASCPAEDISTTSGKDIRCIPSNAQKPFRKKTKRVKDQIYLGLDALPVDQLFYGNVAFESRLDIPSGTEPVGDNDDIVIESNASSSAGLSLYVHSRMKYYLQSQQMELRTATDTCVGIIPYPDRISKKSYPPSITIFSGPSDSLSVTRSYRYQWIQDISTSLQNDCLGNSDPFNAPDPRLAMNEEDDPELQALEKWKYLSDEDVLLPLYGESGSEGEYEIDTLKEIEQERDRTTRPLGSTRNRKLTAIEVEGAIGMSVDQFKNDWDLKRKPKLQTKAWRLWTKSKRDGTAKLQTDRLNNRLESLANRLLKLQSEIIKEYWTSVAQVTKQCMIMQPSIYESEDIKWELSVLTSRIKPEKPPGTTKKPKLTQLSTSEDDSRDSKENAQDSADESECSHGSLEDFVIDHDLEANARSAVDINSELFLNATEAVEESRSLVEGDSQGFDDVEMVDLHSYTQQTIHAKDEPRVEVALPQPPTIDLTLDSDSLDPESSDAGTKPFEIRTPPLNATEDEGDAFERSRKKKAVFKKLPLPSKAQIIDLESDSSEAAVAETPTPMKKLFPPLSDVLGIKSMDPSELVERQDRKRLLTWMLAQVPKDRRQHAFTHIGQISLERSQSETTKALKALLEHKRRIKEVDEQTSDTIMSIAAWQVCWTIPVIVDANGIEINHIKTTLEDKDGFEPFYDFLLDCLDNCHKALDTLANDPSGKKHQKVLSDPQGTQGFTPARKRKYAVNESQKTLNQRQAARNRLQADEERRQEEKRRRGELASGFKGMGLISYGASKVVINPGKLKNQDFIHLPKLFGNGHRIREHQIEGLQFLWREITGEHEDLQGCLLAQTMGLGKTMQVIALLVALAEATGSKKDNVRKQVPPTLQQSFTLVLCPPALLENWCDEFLKWTPRPWEKTIGELWKVSVALTPADRMSEIEAWSEKGGVLLIGYDAFKRLVLNAPKEADKTDQIVGNLLDISRGDRIKKALLTTANLVVADEAHFFKNRTSKLNMAIKQIKTKSRIALTGSPLNNNLEEYYNLIDWIAPNYLGTYTEFKATYEEPINEGLHRESTNQQYYRSRTKLKALEMETEPKVHRANLSVLRTDLEGKMEFVVRLPLTKLQEELYTIFVGALRAETSAVEPRHTSLWSWLGILQLLCNHPKCFRDKLLSTRAELENSNMTAISLPSTAAQPSVSDKDPARSDEDAAALVTEDVTSSAYIEIIDKCEEAFQRLSEPDGALCLSNKMQVLMEILHFSSAAQDKVLVFSHRIATLDYVQEYLEEKDIPLARIDGKLLAQKRQLVTKNFNEGAVNICLISTRAGGTGLNLHGANRVVIMDEHFNPAWELQAIGRAYRIGQKKIVYVYRLTAGGTFEQAIQNQALFKEQLATRVVDKRHLSRSTLQEAKHYLVPPEPVEQQDLKPFVGKDPQVLDHLLNNRKKNQIMSIIPSETLRIEDDVPLSEEQRIEAKQMVEDKQLRRRDPQAFNELMRQRFQPGAGQSKTPTMAYASEPHASASTQPVPWSDLSTGSKGMLLPSSTAPPFPQITGGSPYVDVGHRDSPVMGPPQSVNGVITPAIEAQDVNNALGSTDPDSNAIKASEPNRPGANGHKEKPRHGEGGHRKKIKRKQSSSGQEVSTTKRMKMPTKYSPGFKGTGLMESEFQKLLDKENARAFEEES